MTHGSFKSIAGFSALYWLCAQDQARAIAAAASGPLASQQAIREHWFSQYIKDLGPALYVVIAGIAAILLALILTLVDWRRRRDVNSLKASLAFIFIMPIAAVMGIAAIGLIGALTDRYYYFRLVLGLTIPGVVVGYLLAHISSTMKLQSKSSGVITYLGYLWHLFYLLFMGFFFWGFILTSLKGLPKPVWVWAIVLGWALAPFILKFTSNPTQER